MTNQAQNVTSSETKTTDDDSMLAKESDDINLFYQLHSKKLGEGGFAKVCLATHLTSREKVAIKCLDKVKLGPELPRIYNEIECLKKLKHRNIARLFQVFETDSMIYLVLEYCSGGELFDYIVSKSKLSETESAQILFDLMHVLNYLHINGFAHRDLKPENILFDDKHQIKLIDFGLAANCSGDISNSRYQAPLDQLSTCCGSVTYAAPEIIAGKIYSGTSCDVWSAGVMLYALLIGQLPFNDNSITKLYQKIQAGIKTLPAFLSEEAADLIKKMLVVDPKQRITVPEVLNHPWLRSRTRTFARINRRLEYTSKNQLDEQLLVKCCEKFPTLTLTKLRKYVLSDFNYYSTTYHLLRAKVGTNNNPTSVSMPVKRTPDRIPIKDMLATSDAITPTAAAAVINSVAYVSPTKRARYITVTNSPRAPRTPPSYLKHLQGATNVLNNRSPNTPLRQNLVTKTPTKAPTSDRKEQENNNSLMTPFQPTPKKSIVKRLLDSVTPSKLKQARKGSAQQNCKKRCVCR